MIPTFASGATGLLVFAICVLLSGAVEDSDWDHFVFSQEWPTSVCIDSNITKKHECSIPSTVHSWGVHGLWPSLGSSEGPSFCNRTAKYNHTMIESILDDLNIFWPNLFTDTPSDDFWKHEWEKHGTCAMVLPALGNELRYFKEGLNLRATFDLVTILAQSQIVPDDSNTYAYTDFVSALTTQLTNPQINCVYDKVSQTQYIMEVEFCLDKAFQPIACPTKSVVPLQPRIATRLQYAGAGNRVGAVSMFQQDAELRPINLSSVGPCRDSEPIAYPTINGARL